ncbi:Bug family tripartite tricarboxylate transporter substrate binding protein [Candidimonas nitroreducens]|nr:tripartite tricarboxylate transporter substrate binding protein [Candidimonas nitroreducens]
MPTLVHACRAILALALCSLAVPALAAGYPDRPITFIVPTTPGGAGDTVCRELAESMAKKLGQPIIVENKPGAGGIIGSKLAAKAAPDGYTIVLGIDSALAVSPYLLGALPYHPKRDFAPIGQIGTVQFMLVAAPGSGIDSTAALIARAKAAPGRIPYASGGTGSVHQLAMEIFEKDAGIKLEHIPYKAAPQGFADLMGDHVSVMFIAVGTGLPAAASGRVRALGYAGTHAKDGMQPLSKTVPGFSFESWFGLFAPRGTPAPVVARLSSALKAALQDPAVASKFITAGVEPTWSSPATLEHRLARDIDTYHGLLAKLQANAG